MFLDIKSSRRKGISHLRYLSHLSKTLYNDKIAKVLSMLKEFLKYANQKNYPVNKEFFEYEPTLPQSRK